MAIQVKDVDLRMGHIFIPDSKTYKSRYVPLCGGGLEWLQILVKGKDLEAKLLPNWSYAFIKNHFKGVCKEAGINNLHFHDLRTLSWNGFSPRECQ